MLMFIIINLNYFTVQFSCSVISDPLLLQGLQHARLPVHHQLPELTQTHVYWAGDAIQSSHPLSSPSPPAFNLSQHQRLFQGVSSLHPVAKILEFQLQHQSFQWFPLGWTGWISLQSKGFSRVFSNNTVQKQLKNQIIIIPKGFTWKLESHLPLFL